MRLNKQAPFWTLYKNPEGMRYYQDGMFFYSGGKYAQKHIPIHMLPKDAQRDVKNRGGYKKIFTSEEINAESTLTKIKAEREALAKEREALEKLLKVGVHEEETPEEVKPVGTEPEPVDDDTAGEDEQEQPEEAVFPCPHCDKKYKDQSWLERHIKNKHK